VTRAEEVVKRWGLKKGNGGAHASYKIKACGHAVCTLSGAGGEDPAGT